MNVKADVKCPYCGMMNPCVAEFGSLYGTQRHVYFCDVESGGCDRPFVAALRLSVNAEVFGLVPAASVSDKSVFLLDSN